MDKNIKASITVEASFCVPIFFLVLFSLLYEFNILFGINENYAKLYDAADRYAIYIVFCATNWLNLLYAAL